LPPLRKKSLASPMSGAAQHAAEIYERRRRRLFFGAPRRSKKLSTTCDKKIRRHGREIV